MKLINVDENLIKRFFYIVYGVDKQKLRAHMIFNRAILNIFHGRASIRSVCDKCSDVKIFFYIIYIHHNSIFYLRVKLKSHVQNTKYD